MGKSTLSRGLAREAAKAGLSVKICDLDVQQGSCVDWHRRRLAGGVEPVISVEAYRTAEQALGQATRYDVLIIDAAARAGGGGRLWSFERSAMRQIRSISHCRSLSAREFIDGKAVSVMARPWF